MSRSLFLVVICFVLMFNTSESSRGRARQESRKCEKATIPLCKEIGYNLTYMPNRYGHKTQFQAGLVIHQFYPLINMKCSKLLKHFVCSLYAPMCDPEFHKEIVPCRSFCESVRDKCEPIMVKNGFKWHDNLLCSKFPTREDNQICMKPETDENEPVPTTKTSVQTIIKKVEIAKKTGCGCYCKHPFIRSNSSLTNDVLPPCVLPCGQYFFSKSQQTFLTFWLCLWSVLAFIATSFTLLTFAIDRSKFSYVERPIIYISLCYLLVSFGYILRIVYGHEATSCNERTGLIRYSATGPANCTAVFILTYFFTNVAWIWWVVLSMNWFLSTGLKWTNDAISSYSQYFHFVAWLIPTVQTMAILAMAAIDGDPVAGLCSVGNHDNNTLTIFVIAPLLIYAMLSLSFFVAGVIAKFQVEKIDDAESNTILKTTCQFISRIGVFTFVLFIPVISLLGCYFYEHANRELWEKSNNCDCKIDKKKPLFYAYLLKYLMSLVIGVVIAFWIINARTWESWRNLTKKGSVQNRRRSSRENNNLINDRNKIHNGVAL